MLRLSIVLLVLAEAPRPFDGTFTIVNKANGRRMFASPKSGLFVVEDSGPIYQDQMWIFAPQDNESFAIINAANGMRVVAQKTAVEGQSGFFAVDHGPIYQDQRWWLALQSDGSYSMVNVKSGRKILTRMDEHGKQNFAALVETGPVQDDETWWFINQERDDTARFVAELGVEKDRVAKLTDETALAKNASGQLVQQLQRVLEEQGELKRNTETWRLETLTSRAELHEQRVSKANLAREVAAHQGELVRLQAELLLEKRSREQVVIEATSQQGETVRLAIELETVERAKGRLADAVAIMQSQVAKLSAELNVSSASNLELASMVEVFEALPRSWTSIMHMDMSSMLLATLLVLCCVFAATSCGRRHVGLLADVRSKQRRITTLEQELHAEFGDMVRVGDFDGGLGSDFGFQVFNTEINQEAVRLIKVQCPGVKHIDVEIELIFNGCEVTIHRQASRGVTSATWKRSFQFKPSDGLFEFREEQMALEDGFLQLVFRACAFQNRMVLFPRHFSLADTDTDACWDYAAEGGANGDEAEAWWHDPPATGKAGVAQAAGKPGSLADVDTESTASTARVLV